MPFGKNLIHYIHLGRKKFHHIRKCLSSPRCEKDWFFEWNGLGCGVNFPQIGAIFACLFVRLCGEVVSFSSEEGVVSTEKIVRFEARTDPTKGWLPSERPIDELISTSLVCIRKVKGSTTHQVTQKVKDLLRVSKVGHAGQLEPNMTGLVVVLVEDACKLTSLVTKKDRQYRLRLQFSSSIHRKKLEGILRKFRGKIRQVPPLRSRVRRVLRSREVYQLELESYSPRQIQVFLHCEAGVYIRKLFYEMGRLLRTNVVIPVIQRLAIGDLHLDQAISLAEFQKRVRAYRQGDEKALREVLLPVDHWVNAKELVVEDSVIPRLCCGASLYLDRVCAYDAGIEKEEVVLVRSLKGEIVCLAKMLVSSEEMNSGEDDLLVAQPIRVIMPKRVYSIDNPCKC